MEKIPRLSTQQRSDLVAYLDGELDEAGSREIERILTHSPVARNEVEVLVRTWEMLDHLPLHDAPDDFTERTMSTIRIDDYREPISEKVWFQRGQQGVIAAGWLAGLAVSAVLGFFITNRWIPVETEQLVEELPLIQEIDVYIEVGNIDFVKDLQQSGFFASDVADDTDEPEKSDEPKQE